MLRIGSSISLFIIVIIVIIRCLDVMRFSFGRSDVPNWPRRETTYDFLPIGASLYGDTCSFRIV